MSSALCVCWCVCVTGSFLFCCVSSEGVLGRRGVDEILPVGWVAEEDKSLGRSGIPSPELPREDMEDHPNALWLEVQSQGGHWLDEWDEQVDWSMRWDVPKEDTTTSRHKRFG